MQSYHRRIEYTFEEKKIIVDHIIKRKGYNALRGNAFWQEMEARKVLQRTWQSLKEHFRKKIIDTIHLFDIPNEEKRLIKEGWESSRVTKQDGNGRKVKRPRNNSIINVFSDEENSQSSKDKSRKDKDIENYAISDGSDSSSSSFENTNSRRKRIVKLRNKLDCRRRSPTEFNVFSDEDGIFPDVLSRRKLINDDSSQYDSPDLLNTHVKKTKQITEPSTSGLNMRKNSDNSVAIDSDSDNITVVDLGVEPNKFRSKKDTSGSIDEEASSSTDEFSLEEDLLLINFIKLDATYLRRRKQIDIYNYFHEIYPNSKSAKLLKKRFLNHIFPNICKYNLTQDEMKKFYLDAGVDIPDNLKLLLQESKDNKTSTDKVVQTSPISSSVKNDFQMNICEHELSKSAINCIYCHITLNGQSHIFISDINESSNQDKLFELLSKKFKIDREYIHFTDFVSFFLLEQVNKFRNSIYKQYENIITQSLQDNCENIDVEEVISKLEICVQAFESGDEGCSSESSDENESSSTESEIMISQEAINTQDFNPTDNSTPQRKHSQSVIEENQEIKHEIITYEIELNECDIAETDDLLEIKDEPFSDSIMTEDISKSVSHTDIFSEDYHERIKDENDSQYLESVSTQDSTVVKNVITVMAKDEINVNNSIQIPSSSETLFHTAPEFSQDLK